MLGPVKLVERFSELERELPDDWAEARFALTVADDARCDRAAAMLAPANPGRLGKRIRFTTARRGVGVGPEAVRRLLRRLDTEGIAGELELVGAREAEAHKELRRRPALREQWQQGLAGLPSDWSDLYAEVRFDSTDYVERAALLLSPVNPSRYGGAATLRFRCAHHFGYGVSPEMATRCFERCDTDGITGELQLLRVLSDTHPVGTQGPVWLVGGRSV
jgi:hypothetical protein